MLRLVLVKRSAWLLRNGKKRPPYNFFSRKESTLCGWFAPIAEGVATMLGVVRKIEKWWRRPWPQGRCRWVGPSLSELSSLADHPGFWPLLGFYDKRPWRGMYAIGTDFDIAEDGVFCLFACRVRFCSGRSARGEIVALDGDELDYMVALYGNENRPKTFSVLIEKVEAVARRLAEDAERGNSNES